MNRYHPKQAPQPRPGRSTPRTLPFAAVAACLGALLVSPSAEANDFAFHVEPAAAIWLDDPQSDRFGPGFYFAARPSLVLGRVVSLQATYAMLYTPAAEPFTEDGSAQFLLGGVRVRPFGMMWSEEKQLAGLFADANLGYARTEGLNRFGFDFGLGFNFQPSPVFAMGPVVRYSHIFQPNDNPGEDVSDAQFLSIGLNFTFGTRNEEEPPTESSAECPERRRHLECAPCDDCPEPAPQPAASRCVDPDGDGVCAPDDRCPDVYGPAATLGCPIDPCSGEPLVVLVQFPYDSSTMPSPEDEARLMTPVLDAVAESLAQDPTCRVCITGHTSEEGPSDYNQTLSSERAVAVQDYLESRGVDESRIPTMGMGDSCQLSPVTSRELNRRVEFRQLEAGESCPTECDK